ncbi:hypothetical protein ACFOY4_38725 [Actinomadura syzygii]|uniref:Uncharacterized protein n=1 Tax=Actinomadura syzygii TaxID=1427538 RepID=A0A5D0U7K6_9ACTN|nr:hypothetical protein [Actinomadura syzygii]TYC14318.1 hypothetical protein FXF65_15735 [Actinomadura syzygii]
MHGSQETRLTASSEARPGARPGDVSGIALSESTVSYLDTRLAQGLVTPAAAHDHSTVNDPGAAK